MKTRYLLVIAILLSQTLTAQKYWTGAGISGQWSDGNNWSSGIAPTATDNIILDNSFVHVSYIVNLPSVSTKTIVNTLVITPSSSNSITLIIPVTNTSDSGLYVTGNGDALILNSNAILKNSTGSSPGAVGLFIENNFRINNNGRYIHNNTRGVASIVSQISTATGTEKGIFEYDVPTTASFTASLSNRKYGTLIFSAVASGGSKTYTGNGASDLTVRGDLIINTGANFNSSVTANINVAGDVTINGSFNISPSAGITGRNLLFNGSTNQTISGSGSLSFGPNFRNFRINKNSILTLAKNITINNVTDSIIVDTAATLNLSTYKIDGNSNFISLPFSHLLISDTKGINLIGNNSGNIQTTVSRTFDTSGIYEYNGIGAQITGTALPSSVKNFIINKPDINSLSLSNFLIVNDTLSLQKGFLNTTNSVFIKLRDTTAISSSPSNYNTCCFINNIGWEKSFINGPAIIEINSTTSKWIPVGKISLSFTDTLFAPVQIIKADNTFVTDTVQYFSTAYSDTNTYHAPLDHVSKLEYWNISSNLGTPSNAAQITLSWRPQSKTGDGNSSHDAKALTDLRIAHYFDDDGSGPDPQRWNIEGGASASFNVAPNSTVQNGFITSNNPMPCTTAFTLGTISPFNALPLNLINFSVTQNNLSAQLKWVVENEQLVDKYIIERSNDGNNFISIASVNSLKKILQFNYSVFDNAPLDGWNFYRLKITDNKSKVYFSKILKIKYEAKRQLIIYPNPAKNEIYVQLPYASSFSIIDIVNNNGKIMKHIFPTSALQKINIAFLNKGLYIIRFSNHQENLSETFIKQ